MTLGLILQALEDYLEPLVTAQKGVLQVAETAEDALTILAAASPTKWRAILTADGVRAAEASNLGGGTLGSIALYVQSPKGLETRPGKGLHRQSTGGGPAFLDRLHWVIRKLRAVRFDNDEIDEVENLNFRGWDWVRMPDGSMLRAAVARFEVLYIEDDPEADAEGLAPMAVAVSGRLLPPGGTTGQTLRKRSDADFDFEYGTSELPADALRYEIDATGTYIVLKDAAGTPIARLIYEPV
jgi:hypothetical protein